MKNKLFSVSQAAFKKTLLARAYLSVLFFCTFTVLLSSIFHTDCHATNSATQKTFTRIISLYSAHTENLVSLGASAQLIGISPSDNFPPQILSRKRFSYRDDTERFIAATPDLVLVRPMIERSYPKLISKLRQAGITVVSLQPTSVAEIFDYWRELGRLTGHAIEAKIMIAEFDSRLKAIQQKVDQIPKNQRPRVYFESMHTKMKTFAPTSIAMFALEQAGGLNVAIDATQVHSTNIAEYSKERILAHAQEIDIFLAQRGRMNPVTIEMIRNETGFLAIKAVQENRISLIEEHLVSRPTMRLIEGIEHLHSLLYEEPRPDKGDGP